MSMTELSSIPTPGKPVPYEGRLIGWLVLRDFFEQVVLAADLYAAESDREVPSDFAEQAQRYADRQRVQWSLVRWPDGTELVLLFGPAQTEALGRQLLQLAWGMLGAGQLNHLEWLIRPVVCIDSPQAVAPLLKPPKK